MSSLMKHFGVDEDSECRLLDLLSIFIFMGCDYLSNVKDVGLAKLRKKGYFSKWLKADKEGKEAILDFIEKEGMDSCFVSHSLSFFLTHSTPIQGSGRTPPRGLIGRGKPESLHHNAKDTAINSKTVCTSSAYLLYICPVTMVG